MANSIKDLSLQVDDLQVALDAEQEQVRLLNEKQDAANAALQVIIDELRAEQGDGGTVEDRQALADKIAAVKADLITTAPPTGEETEEEEEEENEEENSDGL